VATPEIVLAAAGSGGGIGEILAALFPPLAMTVVFVLIGRAALRHTDWKKQEDRDLPREQAHRQNGPQEPDASP